MNPPPSAEASDDAAPWKGAELRPRGNLFEDFKEGQIFHHHWGRTLTLADALLFASMTMQMNPLYLNRVYAEERGHKDIPIHPLLVFNVILGLSVEDLSEAGGVFLGVDNLAFHASVYAGDTLRAQSETLATRPSKGRADFGIVRWRTEGFNQNGALVLDYERANLIPRRAAP